MFGTLIAVLVLGGLLFGVCPIPPRQSRFHLCVAHVERLAAGGAIGWLNPYLADLPLL